MSKVESEDFGPWQQAFARRTWEQHSSAEAPGTCPECCWRWIPWSSQRNRRPATGRRSRGPPAPADPRGCEPRRRTRSAGTILGFGGPIQGWPCRLHKVDRFKNPGLHPNPLHNFLVLLAAPPTCALSLSIFFLGFFFFLLFLFFFFFFFFFFYFFFFWINIFFIICY